MGRSSPFTKIGITESNVDHVNKYLAGSLVNHEGSWTSVLANRVAACLYEKDTVTMSFGDKIQRIWRGFVL